ncbi:MAG TPA: nucleotidyltransferase [Phycisphaerales bacterium]|nr:nucleotidyltransferase [Phycisphaerales bacterium]
MSNDFVNLLERLVKNGVDFVIVGGFAGVAHGCTYVTQDIDICCDFSPANLLALQKAISDLDPVHRMTPNRKKLKLTDKTCEQFKNLYLDTKNGQLDCLSFIDCLGDYSRAKQESEFIEVEDMKIRVLSLDALIKTKRAMNRPRDKAAVLQLESIKRLRKENSEASGGD